MAERGPRCASSRSVREQMRTELLHVWEALPLTDGQRRNVSEAIGDEWEASVQVILLLSLQAILPIGHKSILPISPHISPLNRFFGFLLLSGRGIGA